MSKRKICILQPLSHELGNHFLRSEPRVISTLGIMVALEVTYRPECLFALLSIPPTYTPRRLFLLLFIFLHRIFPSCP